jgi:hypothetical protein
MEICMIRGGAAKQIPYFFHLCQKHSDNIARPNKLYVERFRKFVTRDFVIIIQ